MTAQEIVRLETSRADLLAAAEMALEWLDNLCDALGTTVVVDALPNGARGRLQLRAAIEQAQP